MSWAPVTGLTAVALLAITCSSPTLPSRTIIIPPPAIACPAELSPVTVSNGQSATVTYPSPTVTGGTPPVSVSCAPPSGSTFTVGSTPVTCTVTDGVRRTASCSLVVTVVLPQPRLGVTTILAFGDSITEGEVQTPIPFRIRPHDVEPDKSYPADLVTLLARRYTSQGAARVDARCTNDPPVPSPAGILVVNAGCGGERAEDATTLARLNDKIATYHPDVVLLLEGVNDLNARNPDASISAGVQGVQALIGAAETRGVRVMVGTLLPAVARFVSLANLIEPFNTRLVPAAAAAGARIVDLYSDIVTDVTDWISPYDGLHPTEAGYQEMARFWFNNIHDAFELPASTARRSVAVPPSAGVRSGSKR